MQDFFDCITVDFKGSGKTGFVRKYIEIQNADPIFQTLLEIRGSTTLTYFSCTIFQLNLPRFIRDRQTRSYEKDSVGPKGLTCCIR